MERQEFHASKFGTSVLIFCAIALTTFMCWYTVILAEKLHAGAQSSHIAILGGFIALFAILLALAWRGIRTSLQQKGPLAVLDADGLHLPRLERGLIPWQDIRLAEYVRLEGKVFIYLKAGKLFDGSNTIYLNSSAFSAPKRLAECINACRKSA